MFRIVTTAALGFAALPAAAQTLPQPAFLGQMNEAWFQRTIVRKPTPKK